MTLTRLLPAVMCFALKPLSDTIIAICYVLDRPSVSLLALVTLPVFKAIDRSVDTIGVVGIDFVLGNFVTKTIFELIGAPARTDDLHQPIIIFTVAPVAGLPPIVACAKA